MSWKSFILMAKERIYFYPQLLGIIIRIRSDYVNQIDLNLESVSFRCCMPNLLILMQVLKSQLFVDKFSQSSQWTFLDYLAGGCELNFMVAVDFTGNSLQILTLATMGDFFPLWTKRFLSQ